MSIRLMCRSLLVLGACVLGLACGPSTEEDLSQASQLHQEARREEAFCGGIAAIPCPEGSTCIDDPTDDCDPTRGGADCGGLCRREKKKRACTGREPGQRYISRDPAQCATLRFFCEEGSTPFFNECGCGCQKQKKTACEDNDPTRQYVSRDPEQCLAITFICVEGFRPFFDECGCGCERLP